MKVIIVALAFVAVAAAAAIEGEPALPAIKTLRSDNTQTPEGGYSFGFETENGISRNEGGEVKTVQNEESKPQEVVVVRGSSTYTDPDGNIQTINYYADETGYHAEGPSVPKVASRR